MKVITINVSVIITALLVFPAVGEISLKYHQRAMYHLETNRLDVEYEHKETLEHLAVRVKLVSERIRAYE